MEVDNRSRWIKFGKHLTNLSEEYQRTHFNMSWYLSHNGEDYDIQHAETFFNENFCGTTACAIGHLPVIFPGLFKKARAEAWDDLETAILGYTPYGAWDFLFGGDWSDAKLHYDRTSWAVADRIAYILKAPPADHPGDYHHLKLFGKWRGYSVRHRWIDPKTYEERLEIQYACG
jgi:hypothetical protein